NYRLADRRSGLPFGFVAAEGHEFGSGSRPALRQLAPGMVAGRAHSFSSSRADCLFPYRRCGPHAGGPRDSGAHREIVFRKNAGLRAVSESDAETSRTSTIRRLRFWNFNDLGLQVATTFQVLKVDGVAWVE